MRSRTRRSILFRKPFGAFACFCQWYQVDMVDEEGRTWNCCEQYMVSPVPTR